MDILNFINVDPTKLTFKYNEKKGFYCLAEPVDQCLSSAKGRTRSTKYEDPFEKYSEQLEIFKQFYKNQMNNFQHILQTNYKNSTNRFEWLQNYQDTN